MVPTHVRELLDLIAAMLAGMRTYFHRGARLVSDSLPIGPLSNLLHMTVKQALNVDPATRVAISDQSYVAGGRRLGTVRRGAAVDTHRRPPSLRFLSGAPRVCAHGVPSG